MKGSSKLFVFLNLACITTYAGPPFITQDSVIIVTKHFQIYVAEVSGRTNENSDLALPSIEVDSGLMENVEVDVTIPYIWTHSFVQGERNTSGVGDTQINLKLRIAKESKYFPETTLVPVYYIPTGSAKKDTGNGRPWLQLPISMGKIMGNTNIYGVLGYSINGAPQQYNFYFSGLVWQQTINDNWMFGTEIFATGAQGVGEGGSTMLNIGGGYSFSNDLSLLFSVGHTIGGANELVSYFGLYIYI